MGGRHDGFGQDDSRPVLHHTVQCGRPFILMDDCAVQRAVVCLQPRCEEVYGRGTHSGQFVHRFGKIAGHPGSRGVYKQWQRWLSPPLLRWQPELSLCRSPVVIPHQHLDECRQWLHMEDRGERPGTGRLRDLYAETQGGFPRNRSLEDRHTSRICVEYKERWSYARAHSQGS